MDTAYVRENPSAPKKRLIRFSTSILGTWNFWWSSCRCIYVYVLIVLYRLHQICFIFNIPNLTCAYMFNWFVYLFPLIKSYRVLCMDQLTHKAESLLLQWLPLKPISAGAERQNAWGVLQRILCLGVLHHDDIWVKLFHLSPTLTQMIEMWRRAVA